MLRLIIDVLVTSGLLYALALALPDVRLKSHGTAVTVALVYGLLELFSVLADRADRLHPDAAELLSSFHRSA